MKNRSSFPNKLALVQNDISILDGPRTQKNSLEKRLSNVKRGGPAQVFGTGLID